MDTALQRRLILSMPHISVEFSESDIDREAELPPSGIDEAAGGSTTSDQDNWSHQLVQRGVNRPVKQLRESNELICSVQVKN